MAACYPGAVPVMSGGETGGSLCAHKAYERRQQQRERWQAAHGGSLPGVNQEFMLLYMRFEYARTNGVTGVTQRFVTNQRRQAAWRCRQAGDAAFTRGWQQHHSGDGDPSRLCPFIYGTHTVMFSKQAAHCVADKRQRRRNH